MHGRHAELNNLIRVIKILRGQTKRAEPERNKGRDDPRGILNRRIHEKIEIPGEPRRAVERQRLSADDHVFNVVRVE